MILIGQYDSPFVRRVGIAMSHYGIPFVHELWSAFGDAAKIQKHNPLTRVPTLVLDDGVALVDSHCMLDYLDSLVPEKQRMFPVREPRRHRAIRTAGLATGLGDKAVSLFYEKRLHKEVSDAWVERCKGQMFATLDVLEKERSMRKDGGEAELTHEDVATACVIRFISEAHPGLVDMARFPSLGSLCERMEGLPVFQTISQPFVPPS
jgi:glutathione S-transferase